jgi:phosphoglycolate phosphatase
MPKLLLFDIDGTLLIGKGLGREAKAFAMQEVFGTDAGIRTHPFGGKTDWQILVEVLTPHGYTREQIGAQMAHYEQRFAVHMAALVAQFDVQACPGAHDLIAHLRQQADITLGIVTGNTSYTAPIKLQAAGFDPAWFAVGGYGNESDKRADLVRFALERAIKHTGQPISATDVIVIGDTVNDVTAAKALGAYTVTVFTGFEERDALIASNPDVMLDDLTTFLQHVPLS